MRLFVGVTDFDWYQFLAGRPDIDEVNFWQPSGAVGFKTLEPGGIFLFKLHSPRTFIVGGGVFAHWSPLPVSLAWEAFGPKNGTASLEEMRTRLARYRNADDPRVDYTIGCILLEQPFFLEERSSDPRSARLEGEHRPREGVRRDGRRGTSALGAASSGNRRHGRWRRSGVAL